MKLDWVKFGLGMSKGYQLVSHYHLDSLKVSLIIFYLSMVDPPMFFLLLSTRNDLGYLPETQGYSGVVYEHDSLSDPLKVV